MFFPDRSVYLEKPKSKDFVDFHFSRLMDGCVILGSGGREPEVVARRDELEGSLPRRIEALKKDGFQKAKAPSSAVLTKALVAQLSGVDVPAAYEKFLADGEHRRLNGWHVDDSSLGGKIPVFFDDPMIPGWIRRFGWHEHQPDVLPVAVCGYDFLVLVIDPKGAIHFFNPNDYQLEPVAKSLGELAKRMTAK